MSDMTHLDELEAEAIYIMREVVAERFFCNASSGIEGFLS